MILLTKLNIIRRLALVCLAFACLAVMLVFALTPLHVFAGEDPPDSPYSEDRQFGVSPWHKVYLTPGQNYDVGSADKNTTVYIDKPGSYTLHGSSSHMRLIIQSGGVDLYLAHGLNIDPGIYSYVGSRTAAITVDDQGGVVRIISKTGASSYLGSYLYAPAIRKDGRNTQLVFETENPSYPGTIKAHSSRGSHSAGIGGVYMLIRDHETNGNIVFNSGNVIAEGGVDAAAIGGGSGMPTKGITINDGNITATSVGYGAAIGGGMDSGAYDITINGGTVTATANGSGAGAGIGSGRQQSSGSATCKNITINGGIVTATSYGTGSGIGGGSGADVHNIIINGGIVNATGGEFSNGIGGGGGNFGGTATNIVIAGGTVNATGGRYGTGIGNIGSLGDFKTYHSEAVITISGGIVNAAGGEWGIGGGGTGGLFGSGKLRVNILGGTITAKGGKNDIGSGYSDFGLCITGGSIQATKIHGTPHDQHNAVVYKTTITLDQAKNGTQVIEMGLGGPGLSYGLNGVQTINDKLYLWLPNGGVVKYITAEESFMPAGLAYSGSVATGSQGTLYPATPIVLIGDYGASNGSAQGVTGEKSFVAFVPSKHSPSVGMHVDHYVTANSPIVKVADATGKYYPNTPCADANGAWKYNPQQLLLRSVSLNNTYTVAFDANRPANASHAVTGTMGTQTFTWGEYPAPLQLNKYSLPGWDFMGWSKTPDGNADYTDGGRVIGDLTVLNGVTVTLYAKWQPKTYTVNFNAGGGTGIMPPATLAYDTPAALPANTFSPPDDPGNETFLGWSRYGFGSQIYADGATVLNLCSIEGDGAVSGLTLQANWIASGGIAIVVTDDDTPVPGLAGSLSLSLGDMNLTGFSESPSDPGVYILSDVPDETYEISLTGYDTAGKTITVHGGMAAQYLNYCTVEISSDPNCDAWFDVGGNRVSVLSGILVGSSLDIRADTSSYTGHSFKSYSAVGYEPVWAPNRETPNQTIIVTGKTQITAHSRPILYRVEFDGNGGAAEEPAEPQDFVYGEPQNLFANTFEQKGYSFAGWNTSQDGTGTSYDDGESVTNLTTADGAAIGLFAQWTPNTYTIEFNSNGATGGAMPAKPAVYDTLVILTKNTYTRINYHFMGWNTSADGSGTLYGDEGDVSNLAADEGAVVILYAQWEHDYYTVQFGANGGSGFMADQELWSDALEKLDSCAFYREYYYFLEWNTAADGSGTSYANSALVTDLAAPGGSLTLFAQWAPKVYYVEFDSNNPSVASHSVAGNMPVQALVCGVPDNLNDNEYKLAGWTFIGWNASADGSDTMYADKEEVENLAYEDGDVVVLYAQWAPQTYIVSFDAGGGSGAMSSLTMTYDTPAALPANAFSPPSSPGSDVFLGWSRMFALGAQIYSDEATVINICSLDTDGITALDLTLEANWIAQGSVVVVVTDDDEPVNGLASATPEDNKIYLTQGLARFSGFLAAGADSGVYILGNPVTPGVYGIAIDGYDTSGKTINISSGTDILYLEYCTVEIGSEPNCDAWINDSGAKSNIKERVPVGSALEIRASTSAYPGYIFEAYTAIGYAPVWSPDETKPEQTIIVTGRALIEAHPVPVIFRVDFEGNHSDVTGIMEPQDFVYDQPQNLFYNGFDNARYHFSGWNTTSDGVGTSYDNGESVTNLTNVDGGIVTLYAQWDKHLYPVLEHFGTWFGSGTASARVGVDHGDFERLTLNGVEVNSADYDITPGSTVITLKTSHLAGYANGSYTLVAQFSGGFSEGLSLIVRNPSNIPSSETSKTGDEMNLPVWQLMMTASLIGMLCVLFIALHGRKRVH